MQQQEPGVITLALKVTDQEKMLTGQDFIHPQGICLFFVPASETNVAN